MDLMDLKPKSDTIEVILKHPNTLEPLTNDDGSEMTVTVHAQHSKEYTEELCMSNKTVGLISCRRKVTTSTTAADLETILSDLLAQGY
jgi:hypothetical protein